jgi:hypothetical protein
MFSPLPLLLLVGCGDHVRVVYKVVDEQQQPIAEAKIVAGYSTGGGWTGRPTDEHIKVGYTDRNGVFVYSGFVQGPVWASIERAGYYKGFALKVEPWHIREGKWRSTSDPMELVLKRIIQPVAM